MENHLQQRLDISIGCIRTLKHICEGASTKHIEVDIEFLDILQTLLKDCRDHISKAHICD